MQPLSAEMEAQIRRLVRAEVALAFRELACRLEPKHHGYFGEMITRAIAEEIKTQHRPGGLLSGE